jgi:hypothetical protein
MPRLDKPAADTIEVSLFGPGYGEAIAVHLGQGEWITVDSCRDDRSGENALLQYFRTIGVDPSVDVKRVIATHAHDDHIKGISSLFAASTSAQFVWSAACYSDDFFALVDEYKDTAYIRPTILAEFVKVVGIIEDRKRSSARYPAMRAMETLEIFSRPASASGPSVQVTAMSPSHASIDRAMRYLAQCAAFGRYPKPNANVFSIALWVQVGDISVLLGGDLTNGPKFCGWNAILNLPSLPTGASLYKVAHHGATTSNHPDIWTSLLTPDVTAILTPERGPNRTTPSATELAEVKSLAGSTYITAKPEQPIPPKKVHNARSELLGLATDVRDLGLVGHIRLRHGIAPHDKWQVHLVDPAYAI